MKPEEKLVAEILAGNPDAEREFFETHRPRLLRASWYFLGGQDAEAEDIVQETFIIAYRKMGGYVFRAPIYAWLRQICLRLCYARLRARKRVLVSLEEDLEVFMRGLSDDRLRDQAEESLKSRRLQLLRTLTMRLNVPSREIIELRDVRGMRYAAIGRTLDIPVGTVMSRLARARDQLRKLVAAGELEAGAGPAPAVRRSTTSPHRR